VGRNVLSPAGGGAGIAVRGGLGYAASARGLGRDLLQEPAQALSRRGVGPDEFEPDLESRALTSVGRAGRQVKAQSFPVQTKHSRGIHHLDPIRSPEFHLDGDGDQHAAQAHILHRPQNCLSLRQDDSDVPPGLEPRRAPRFNPVAHSRPLVSDAVCVAPGIRLDAEAQWGGPAPISCSGQGQVQRPKHTIAPREIPQN